MADMRCCRAQTACSTPDNRGFNLGGDAGTMDFRADHAANWIKVPVAGPNINLYWVGWEQFIRRVAEDAALKLDYATDIRDVQFAEACLQSSEIGAWVAMTPLG